VSAPSDKAFDAAGLANRILAQADPAGAAEAVTISYASAQEAAPIEAWRCLIVAGHAVRTPAGWLVRRTPKRPGAPSDLLQTQVDLLIEQRLRELVAEAVAAERARIVAALRKAAERFERRDGKAPGLAAWIEAPGVALLATADALEQGE
jgi:hypothetical protein